MPEKRSNRQSDTGRVPDKRPGLRGKRAVVRLGIIVIILVKTSPHAAVCASSFSSSTRLALPARHWDLRMEAASEAYWWDGFLAGPSLEGRERRSCYCRGNQTASTNAALSMVCSVPGPRQRKYRNREYLETFLSGWPCPSTQLHVCHIQ